MHDLMQINASLVSISTQLRPRIKNWYAFTHEYPSLAGNAIVATSFARMRELCVQLDACLRDCERLAAQLPGLSAENVFSERLALLHVLVGRFLELATATNQRVTHAIRCAPPGMFRQATPEEILRRRAAGM